MRASRGWLAVPFRLLSRFVSWYAGRWARFWLWRKARRVARLSRRLEQAESDECTALRHEIFLLDEKLRTVQVELRLSQKENESLWVIVARDRKRIEKEMAAYAKQIARSKAMPEPE